MYELFLFFGVLYRNKNQSRTIKKTVLRSNSASGRRSLNFLYFSIAQFIRWLGEEYMQIISVIFFRHLSSFCFTITINICEIEHVIDKSFWFVKIIMLIIRLLRRKKCSFTFNRYWINESLRKWGNNACDPVS